MGDYGLSEQLANQHLSDRDQQGLEYGYDGDGRNGAYDQFEHGGSEQDNSPSHLILQLQNAAEQYLQTHEGQGKSEGAVNSVTIANIYTSWPYRAGRVRTAEPASRAWQAPSIDRKTNPVNESFQRRGTADAVMCEIEVLIKARQTLLKTKWSQIHFSKYS